jgi:Icc protein
MVRAAWITDPHLNFLDSAQLTIFLDDVAAAAPDMVLIGGDIGEAHNLLGYLTRIADTLRLPVYFVLGNHDYYRSSIAHTRHAVMELAARSPHLTYLPHADVITLGPDTALIGHGGWVDGRLGDWDQSQALLTDYLLIQELAGLGKADRFARLNALADEAADYVRRVLPRALAQHRHVFLLTHVPPFQASCWHQGRPAPDDDPLLPHFGCRVMGEVLVEIMATHPDRELTVLCGHTHGAATYQPLANLLVLTGGAEYGSPVVQRVFEVG